jgi:hypothetical protein
MNTHTTVGAPARVRGRWLWAGGAVLAVGAVGVVLAITSSSGGQKADSAVASKAPALVTSAAQDARRVPPILSLTPAELAGGVLGTSYALSRTPTGPTTASVLRSMSPETRRYTKAVMALTFAQLAAGAAGSP